MPIGLSDAITYLDMLSVNNLMCLYHKSIFFVVRLDADELLSFTGVHQPVSNAACVLIMCGSMLSSSTTTLTVGAMSATKALGVARDAASVSGVTSVNSSCSCFV